MIKNHALLDWLSFNRALAGLKKTADSEMTEEDLLNHCVHGNCSAYIKASGMSGLCSEALSSLEESQGLVYGVGYHKVLNPEAFAAPAVHGADKAVLLRGDVLLMPDPDSERLIGTEWEASEALNRDSLLFKKADIDELSVSINQEAHASGFIQQPVARSQMLALSALVELLKDKQRPIYHAQGKIIEAIQKKFPDDGAGVGNDTLKKLFADANKEKRQFLKAKKVQMQK